MTTVAISGAGAHAAAAATDRIPASKTPFTPGTKGYLTPSQIKDYILGLANTWTANQTLTGHLLFSPTNTYDIGAVGGTRPRDLFVANTINAGVDIVAGSNLRGINFVVGSSQSYINCPSDGVIGLNNSSGNGFNRLQLGGTTAAFSAVGRVAVTGGWGLTFPSAADTNGQCAGVETITELLTIAAAASTDTAILQPANALILGVSVRNTVALPITSTYTVGDAGSAARFSTAAVSKAVNSTDPGTKAGAYYNASATAVRITPDTTPSDATGRVRVTIHYIKITPPTS